MNTNTKTTPKTHANLRKLTVTAVLGAIASVLFVFPEIPIIPPIYKLDFSTLAALLAGFAMGPVYGLAVVLIKDLTGMLHSSSMYVGELADFLMSGAFVVTASLVYARRRNISGALIGMVVGVVLMTIAGVLTNYYIMIPFYIGAFQMSEQAIIGMVAKTIPAVNSLWRLILLAAVPFNLVKGIALSVVTLLIYKRISPLLKGKA